MHLTEVDIEMHGIQVSFHRERSLLILVEGTQQRNEIHYACQRHTR